MRTFLRNTGAPLLDWTTLGFLPLSNGAFEFTDPDAPAHPREILSRAAAAVIAWQAKEIVQMICKNARIRTLKRMRPLWPKQ